MKPDCKVETTRKPLKTRTNLRQARCINSQEIRTAFHTGAQTCGLEDDIMTMKCSQNKRSSG